MLSRGPNNGANWKGGRVVDPRGYVLIWVGKDHPLADVRGYAYEHRLIAQGFIDRPLTSADEIHHGDEQPSNNDPGNLSPPISRAEHKLLHRKLGSDRRLPGEDNPEIECRCGCGGKMLKYDDSGRPREFLPGHVRRGTGRENPIIECACGCGGTFPKYDSGTRARRFIIGHNRGPSPMRDAVLQVLRDADRPLGPLEIAAVADIPRAAAEMALHALKKTGAVQRLGYGRWSIK